MFDIDIQGMLDQLFGYPRHICWFPRKYVSVGPKEVDERKFLFVIELGAYHGRLRGIAFLELDGLDTNLSRCHGRRVVWLRCEYLERRYLMHMR